MVAKKRMKESRGRKWSEDELKEFASVLADDRTEFALKKSAKGAVIKYRGGWAMKNWGGSLFFITLKRVGQEK